MIKDFWQFVHERQEIWEKRKRGIPKPWTTDPVLRDNFFTNVFREFDTGTFVAIEIMSTSGTLANRLWKLQLYRRLNRESTWYWIHKFSRRQLPKIEKVLRSISGPIFTGAHQVNMLQSCVAGADPIARLVNVMRDVDISAWKNGLLRSRDAHEAFETTLELAGPGIGGFLAWQLVLDARYAPEIQDLYSDDEWAPVQAGAKAGLEIVMPELRNSTEREIALSQLRDYQKAEFKKRGLKFVPWLTLAAIEHSLCEYSKYHRIALGGHAKGKFDGR